MLQLVSLDHGTAVLEACHLMWIMHASYHRILCLYNGVFFVCSNEKNVGVGIKQSGIPRSDIFVVTKVWGDNHGYDMCKTAFANSLKKYADSLYCNFM